jgi:KDO2-lipid IV(A) lauroyltransferase
MEVNPMNLVKFATSRWGASFFMNLCQLLPLPLAYRLGDHLAGRVQKKQNDPCLEAFQANIAVVHGWPIDDPRVENAVSNLLRNIAHSYVDLFKAIKGGSESIVDACEIDPSAVEALQKSVASGQGTIVVGAHMCGFDFGLLALKKLLPDIQLMGNPNPVGGMQVMHQIRLEFDLNVTPISMHSLRHAVETLKAGGIIGLAVDLPIENGEELDFFGKKARMTVGHTRLAMKTQANILVVDIDRREDGKYHISLEPIQRPDTTKDRKNDATRWAQDALLTLEKYIRESPEEWVVPFPVWTNVGLSGA